MALTLRTRWKITRVAVKEVTAHTAASFLEVLVDHLSDLADHLRGYPPAPAPQRHLQLLRTPRTAPGAPKAPTPDRSSKTATVVHLPAPRPELTPEQAAARAAAMARHPAGSKLPTA